MPPLVAALGRRRPRVDVSTGNVVLDETDLELPGLLPLVLRRTHVSSWQHGQWFGARWASLLEERLAPSEHSPCCAQMGSPSTTATPAKTSPRRPFGVRRGR